MCYNSFSSYACECSSGFVGNGTTCEDLDECHYDLSNCGDNSFCINTHGAFECICNSGFIFGSNGTCVDVNECLNPQDSNHNCSYDPEGNGSIIYFAP